MIAAEPPLVVPTLTVAPEDLPPIVKRLKEWRDKNHLSRRQAAAVLQRFGCPVTASAIRVWEAGGNPREAMAKALEDVLEKHPTIVDPPRFGRWVKEE